MACADERKPCLLMSGINKRFGPVEALKEASLDLYPGEVLALMGENGAGKSTLMNILSGASQADQGRIELDGRPVEIHSPLAAQDLGICKIHQELQIVPEMSIAENIFLGRWPRGVWGKVRYAEMEKAAARYLEQLNWPVDTRRKLKDLRIGEQQLVEIAKALSLDSRILIMDEPTSALSEQEVKRLFEVIRRLRLDGKSIIYITHRMNEVFEISDRLIVMRDGSFIGSRDAGLSDTEEIIAMMVGRSMKNQFPHRQAEAKESSTARFAVRNLCFEPSTGSFKRRLTNISFSVQAGEVLGFAGLAGSGRSELLESLAGRYGSRVTAEYWVDGADLRIRQPKDALKAGLCLATEDRKGSGLVLGRGIGENLSLPQLKQFSRALFMLKCKEGRSWQEALTKMKVKAASAKVPVSNLSGGNQQKVVLARWLMMKPKVLLLDEPTRGIDVGAKEEIYQIINEMAAQGLAIILVSSELPELIGMSDRIFTLFEGRISGEFNSDEVTQEMLLHSATNTLQA